MTDLALALNGLKALKQTAERSYAAGGRFRRAAKSASTPYVTHVNANERRTDSATSEGASDGLDHRFIPSRSTVQPLRTPATILASSEPLSSAVEEFSRDQSDLGVTAPAKDDDYYHSEQATASRVPSSKLERLASYGGLAFSLGVGTSAESFRRLWRGNANNGSLVLSEANVRRIVDKLSRMRGAALKIGQFLSIQDSKALPPQVAQILQRVQNRANYMPDSQTEKVLNTELGRNWRSSFTQLDMTPFASASIGQVHRGSVPASAFGDQRNGRDTQVAVKIQFPGVRQSISSDLSYLRWLLVASAALPRGLYLENTLKVLEQELEDECDYEREAKAGRRMRQLLRHTDLSTSFTAPQVVQPLSTRMVLTTTFANGQPLGTLQSASQAVRDKAGSDLLNLCLHELFVFFLMQTDPNWSNFLYDAKSRKISLVDFGATREYGSDFIELYKGLMLAAVRQDRAECLDLSTKMGYLTGQENEDMLTAHLSSLYALASPFRRAPGDPFDFGKEGGDITRKVRAQIPVMLKHRLSPPPRETLSLNRKLSGIFLLCEALGSRVDAAALLEKSLQTKAPPKQELVLDT